MPRSAVAVRDARAGDVPAIMTFWEGVRDASGRHGILAPAPVPERTAERLAELAECDDVRLMVAELDDEVVGMALLQRQAVAPMVDQDAIQVSYLYVRPGLERRGIGKALMTSALALADELGLDHVSTSVFPQDRDTQRFFARLGFSPLVVRRVASTARLRRGLGAEAGTHLPQLHDLQDRLARRRTTVRARRARAVAAEGDAG